MLEIQCGYNVYSNDILFGKYVIFSKLKRKARNKMQNCPKLSFNFSFIHRIFFLYARIIVILLLVCILYSNCSDYFFSNKFYILKSNCKDLILNPNHPGRGGGAKLSSFVGKLRFLWNRTSVGPLTPPPPMKTYLANASRRYSQHRQT